MLSREKSPAVCEADIHGWVLKGGASPGGPLRGEGGIQVTTPLKSDKNHRQRPCVLLFHFVFVRVYEFRFLQVSALVTQRLRFHLPLLLLSLRQIKMKIAIACILLTVCLVSAFPQKDGAIFSNEAIRQAQNTFLIPKDAQIQKVQEGIEVAAYENIKGDESINLFQILGDQVPPEVVSNLQAQVEQIGKH